MPIVKGLGAAGNLIDHQMDRFARSATVIETRGLQAAGRVVQAAVARNLGGETIRMRGVGTSGANVGTPGAAVGVRVTTIGKDVIVRMTGPAHLLENDVKPHWVGLRKEDRTGEAPHMRLPGSPDGWGTGPWFGSRSTGKHPFRNGVAEARPLIPRIFQSEVIISARTIFH